MDRIYVMELVRSFQLGQIGRRAFLSRAAKALGSMAAAQLLLSACQHEQEENPEPVVQSPRRDDGAAASEGAALALVTGMVAYPGDQDEESLMGYLAKPQQEGAFPAVIVVQEWWGVDEHIKDVTRRFAQAGFSALAPDLYHGVVTSEPDQARKLVMELDMEAAVAELRKAVDYLLSQRFVAGPKAGLVGFCMGGRLALQTARHEEQLGAVVAFYGAPLSAEETAQVKAPIMGNYGSLDQGIPLERIQAMQAALDRAGIENDVKVYEGAMHAFFNDARPSGHHPEASKDAWGRTLSWFRKYLGK